MAQCTFKCPLERWEQRRAARAASLAASRAGSSELPTAPEPPNAESPSAESPSADSIPKRRHLARMESMSSMSDSQDGDLGVISQQPIGKMLLSTIVTASCCIWWKLFMGTSALSSHCHPVWHLHLHVHQTQVPLIFIWNCGLLCLPLPQVSLSICLFHAFC